MRATVRGDSGYVYGIAETDGTQFIVYSAPEGSGYNWFNNEAIEMTTSTPEEVELYLHEWAEGLVDYLNKHEGASWRKFHAQFNDHP